MQKYKQIWTDLMERKIPIMIVGGVGIGKTETFQQIAKEMDRELIFIHLSRRSNMDFIIPKLENGTVKYSISETFVNVCKNGKAILFFDEYDRADGLTRNAILSLINERKFEHLNLPDDVSIVLACNQDSSRDTFSLNQAEISRTAYFKIQLDLTQKGWYAKSWLEYAQKKQVDGKIIAYLMNEPSLLYKPTEEITPFPTPRGWVNLSKLVDVLQDKKFDHEVRLETISALIGSEAASKFLTYLDIFSTLPPAEEIIRKKMEFKNPNQLIAVIEHLGFYARENPEKLNDVLTYIEKHIAGEFLYMFVLLTKNQLRSNYTPVIRKNERVRSLIFEIGEEAIEL